MSAVEKIARKPHVRSEKAEEALCDDLVARFYGRGAVVRFSQARASMQTPGIPDRRYRLGEGLIVWWEVKATDGRLSRHQVDFLTAENLGFCPAGCGDLESLAGFIRMMHSARTISPAHARGTGLMEGQRLVSLWSLTPAKRRETLCNQAARREP